MHIREIPAVKRVSPPVGKIREVFLSATVQDLDDERKAVRDALRGRHTTVWLQEDWNQGYADTLSACATFLEKSSGYIGIVGFFSGWIPDGCDCSITELESSWARQRWGVVDPPPIFYFLPQPGSRSADDLMKKAEQALLEHYPDDEDARENRKKLQADFRQRVCGQGRIVLFFSDIQELRERACNAVSLWNEEVLERAPSSREIAPSYRIPSEELGRIGRELQLQALEALMAARERRPEPEALCAVAHGPPRSGLLGFTDCLASWIGWELERKIEPGAPLGDSYDVRSLTMWGLRMVVGEAAILDSGIDALAAAISARLAQEPIVLILQRVDNLDGGLASFHRDFWLPLCAALTARRKKGGSPYRFSMVVATHSPDTTAAYIRHGDWSDAPFDGRQLQPLPPLGNLRAVEVENWLAEQGIPRSRRVAIASQVIDGGNPLEVYEGLQEHGFWKEIAEGGAG